MPDSVKIWIATRDEEIDRCFPVMVQLRPHLARREFVERVRRMQAEGFRLVALEQRGVVRAVAGYRIFDLLFCNRTLYVDDLVTDQDARSQGYGKTLLTWSEDADRLGPAAQALAEAARRGSLGRMTVESADGAQLLGSGSTPVREALQAAGFLVTPRGLRLRAGGA